MAVETFPPTGLTILPEQLQAIGTDGAIADVIQLPENSENPHAVLNNYLQARQAALEIAKLDGPGLLEVQEAAAQWLREDGRLENDVKDIDYSTYSREIAERKIGGLIEFLSTHYADKVSPEELTASRLFLESTFGMYENAPDLDAETQAAYDGSFAFVVPPRMSRNNPEYGSEVEPSVPVLRYVPNELRGQLMVGLPPFVIDVYEPTDSHRPGYLVLAPVYSDMATDQGKRQYFKSAQEHVNNAVDFAANKLGVNVIGLGAHLPALTHYGQRVKNENVVTTTGHGGTTFLIKETVTAAIEKGYLDGKINPSIGVLGLGAIGASIAELMASEFPNNKLHIYDLDEDKNKVAGRHLSEKDLNFNISADVGRLVEESDIIISAIVGKVKLADLGVSPDLTDKIVIDDSQPGSFDPSEVEAHGGNLVWVVGHDTQNVVVRLGYDYATLDDNKRDVFGCEAEAATLARYAAELSDVLPHDEVTRQISRIALRAAVTPQTANAIGGLFKRYGVEVAQFQNFGNPIKPSLYSGPIPLA